MGDAFPTLVNDIGKLVNDNQGSGWEEPVFKVYDEWQDAVKALRQLGEEYAGKDVVVDIEAGIEKDTAFDHPERYQMLCVGFSYAPHRAIVIGENALQHSSVKFEMRQMLPKVRLVAQNGKFDLPALMAYLGMSHLELSFDTMLASYCMDERPGMHGLKYRAVEELGAPQYDAEIDRYVGKNDTYAVVPRPVLYKYNAYDCSATFQLKLRDQERLGDQQRVHDFLVEASNQVQHMEMAGIDVDQAYLDELTESYLEVLEELEKPLNRWVKNPRSPKQVKEALYDMGIRVGSTNQETLEGLLPRVEGEAQEFIALMLRHRREQKLYGTYVKGTRKRLYRGRVHPTFLLHGTTTGRLACRNPNIHNVPRESRIRRLFVPGEGNKLIGADYKQAELRAIATEAEDTYLQGVLNDDSRDIHGEVAERFFGPGWTKEQRVRAKAVVFGLGYGREAYSLHLEYGWPIVEAERYITEFFGLIPQVAEWREWIKHEILDSGNDLVTRFGRHRRFWLITRENKKDVVKEGLAFVPQSTASDICLAAGVRLRRDYGIDVRFMVHDAVYAVAPEDQAEDVAAIMGEVMPQVAVDLYSDYVRFPVDVKIGDSWGDLD